MKNNLLSSLTLHTPYLTRIVSLGTSGVRYTALAGLISLALFSTATATGFSGSLKGVTITDAANTNKPPVAAFTYAINGNTVTFDASNSSDPDGTISQYNWDFGDGTKNSGQKTSYDFGGASSKNITLTVIDNAGAVSITQQIISTGTTCSTVFYQGAEPATNTYRASSEDYYTYSGGRWLGEDKKLCGAQFYIGAVIGDISSKQFNIKIYSTDGNNKITTLKGISDTIQGSDIKDGWGSIVKFTPPITISKGDAVVLAEINNNIDSLNFIILTENQTSGSEFQDGIWGSSFSNSRSFDRAVLAKLYE